MSQKTEQEIQARIVELRKAGGRTSSRAGILAQLKAEGVAVSPTTISRTLREKGLTDPTRWRGPPGRGAGDQDHEEDHAAADVEPTARPRATPGGMREFQPPPVRRVKPKLRGRCTECGTLIEWEHGEKVETCPACGVAFDE